MSRGLAGLWARSFILRKAIVRALLQMLRNDENKENRKCREGEKVRLGGIPHGKIRSVQAHEAHWHPVACCARGGGI